MSRSRHRISTCLILGLSTDITYYYYYYYFYYYLLPKLLSKPRHQQTTYMEARQRRAKALTI